MRRENYVIVQTHMQRAGNCKFLRRGLHVHVEIGQWNSYLQEYVYIHNYLMDITMLNTICTQRVYQLAEELLTGKNVTVSGDLMEIPQGYQIFFDKTNYIIRVYYGTESYDEPQVFIGEYQNGYLWPGLSMDVPSFHKLLCIEDVYVLREWGSDLGDILMDY